jgi:DNA-binding NarL/FixJ family response regulator
VSVRVLIADDNAVIRHGVRSLLEAGDGVEVVGEAGNGREAIARADELRPDVVLLDVRMPIMDGLAALGPLRERARVMMLTYADDERIVAEAVRGGASGYLVHGRFGADELASAVRALAAGESVLSPSITGAVFDALRAGAPAASPEAAHATAAGDEAYSLTAREAEVMNLAAQGLSRSAIAARLVCSEKTVKNHINRIYGKLGAANRAEAVSIWLGTARPGER